MMTRSQFGKLSGGLFSLALMISMAMATRGANPSTRNAALDSARQILQATGVEGGLIVHLGCGDGALTAALHVNDSYLVQGLDSDPKNVEAARKYVLTLGVYGKISIEPWAGKQLPYAENLVNLLVSENPGGVPMAEVMRVLAPGGVAYVKQGDTWTKTVKPWPESIGPWTHFLQDASGNAVAQDRTVGPPGRLQWEAGPRWCRSHEFPSSVNAVVTAGGRVFAILDEAPIGVYKKLPQHCVLVARDAFNGLPLWKRPMNDWDFEHGTGLGDRWHIHQTLPRRLVAQGDRVFATLSFRNSPVSVLDAATGKVLTKALEGTAGTDEMLLADDVLVVRITDGSPSATAVLTGKDLRGDLAAVDIACDRLLWRKSDVAVAPYAMAMADGRLVYHNLSEVVCLDARSGRLLWRVPHDAQRLLAAGSTLVLSGGVVLYHGYGRRAMPKGGAKRRGFEARLTAFSADDGRQLWTAPGAVGLAGACTEPTDVFVVEGLVWCGGRPQGRDLHTGEVKKTLDLGKLISPGHHYRCYRSKATERFLIYPKRGAEFVDVEGHENMRNDWLRGPCFTGMVPANGLLYVPPSQCFCYPGVKLNGFLSLAPEGTAESGKPKADDRARLEKGPAYAERAVPNREAGTPDAADWAMYRHDRLRSGATRSEVPVKLTQAWEVPLACTAAQPAAVGDRLFVAEKDVHRIRCLAAGDGREIWAFTAGGRIDSSPTVYDGLVLFGCRDGFVYCLRAGDGALAWRFRAAPRQRLVMSYGQLESAWPVDGSVLVQDGVVYFAAGRSSFLDGGLFVYGLNPHSGAVLHRAHLEGPWPDVTRDVGSPFAMEGARSDLLVSDGRDLYMQRIKFDASLHRLETPQITTLGDLDQGGRHLLATGGFLDDSAFDRLFWMYTSRWPGFYFTQQAPKSGQLIVFDEQTAYAVKYFYRRNGLSPAFVPAEEGYLLFADAVDNEPILVGRDGQPAAIEWLPKSARTGGRYLIANRAVDMEKGVGFTRSRPAKWQELVPVRARAMVLAANALLLAGPPDAVDANDPLAAFEGRKAAVLQVISPADGKRIAELPLAAPPVFDGMSAAHGRLFLATVDGKLLCFAGR